MNVGNANTIAHDMMTTAGLTMPTAQAQQPTAAPAAAAATGGQSQYDKFAIMYRQNYPNATDEQIEQVYLSHGGVL